MEEARSAKRAKHVEETEAGNGNGFTLRSDLCEEVSRHKLSDQLNKDEKAMFAVDTHERIRRLTRATNYLFDAPQSFRPLCSKLTAQVRDSLNAAQAILQLDPEPLDLSTWRVVLANLRSAMVHASSESQQVDKEHIFRQLQAIGLLQFATAVEEVRSPFVTMDSSLSLAQQYMSDLPGEVSIPDRIEAIKNGDNTNITKESSEVDLYEMKLSKAVNNVLANLRDAQTAAAEVRSKFKAELSLVLQSNPNWKELENDYQQRLIRSKVDADFDHLFGLINIEHVFMEQWCLIVSMHSFKLIEQGEKAVELLQILAGHLQDGLAHA